MRGGAERSPRMGGDLWATWGRCSGDFLVGTAYRCLKSSHYSQTLVWLFKFLFIHSFSTSQSPLSLVGARMWLPGSVQKPLWISPGYGPGSGRP